MAKKKTDKENNAPFKKKSKKKLEDAFSEEQIGPMEILSPEHEEINRLTAINDSLNEALGKKDEEIVILKSQFQWEKDEKQRHFENALSHKRRADDLDAQIWDITHALTAPVGWFNKAKRRLQNIERIITRKK